MIMKYFLDSAKLDEIKLAYNTFGIDGVTTNPRHIMLSGKPFLTDCNTMYPGSRKNAIEHLYCCLLYTSDAADE